MTDRPRVAAAAPALLVLLFVSVVAVAVIPAQRPGRPVVYAAVGPELTQFDVDVERATLTKRGSITLPANVQEAALHPSGDYIYIATSNGGPSATASGAGAGSAGSEHRLLAFRIDRSSGALTPHGAAALLPSRPIHVTIDVTGTHVLSAFNDPSGVTVHGVRADGTVGEEVKPPSPVDAGIYGHQIRVAPSNRTVILVTRGNNPTNTRPEDPGALKILDYKDGIVTNRATIAPEGGYGYQSRHLDFHPSRPWLYLTLERQNKLLMYRIAGETIGPAAAFTKDTLAHPRDVHSGQTTSTIHVHPNGRFVYVGNRSSATAEVQGRSVWAGGENSIGVFAIDQNTGEPTLIQNADTHGFNPRTFALDAGGRVLVVGNQLSVPVRDGERVKTVPASLTIFRIRDNGTLEFSQTYPVEVAPSRSLFWMGMASIR
jgi:6-phosphogluconolactonase (cycloisomerase 2 family)